MLSYCSMCIRLAVAMKTEALLTFRAASSVVTGEGFGQTDGGERKHEDESDEELRRTQRDSGAHESIAAPVVIVYPSQDVW